MGIKSRRTRGVRRAVRFPEICESDTDRAATRADLIFLATLLRPDVRFRDKSADRRVTGLEASSFPGDLRFEPASALASGSDGLDDIRRIVDGARAQLLAGGWLLFEHGWDQGAAARGLLQAADYRDVFTAQDLERRDRVSGGRIA